MFCISHILEYPFKILRYGMPRQLAGAEARIPSWGLLTRFTRSRNPGMFDKQTNAGRYQIRELLNLS